MAEDDGDGRTYDVVVNDEGQYSIWVVGSSVPDGWRTTGTRGSKAACLSDIGQVWTDMRPASLRAQMGA